MSCNFSDRCAYIYDARNEACAVWRAATDARLTPSVTPSASGSSCFILSLSYPPSSSCKYPIVKIHSFAIFIVIIDASHKQGDTQLCLRRNRLKEWSGISTYSIFEGTYLYPKNTIQR